MRSCADADYIKSKRLLDAYRFAGFRPREQIKGVFGDPHARVVTLVGRSKKTTCGVCGRVQSGWHERRTRRVRDLPCGPYRIFLEFEVRRVYCRSCQAVKREGLDFLSDSPFYTKRFAYYIGQRCRNETISALAQELRLDWDSVKVLDKRYMKVQLAKAGTLRPRRIGIDEISIKKRHTYRIVVSDLDRKRPIWFGGADRSEARMA